MVLVYIKFSIIKGKSNQIKKRMEVIKKRNEAPFEKLFIQKDNTEKNAEIVDWLAQMIGKSDLPFLPEDVLTKILHHVPPRRRTDAVRVGNFVFVASRPPCGLCIPIIEFIRESENKRNGVPCLSPYLEWAYGPLDEIHDKSSSSEIINTRRMLDFYYEKVTLESILEIAEPDKE